MQNGDTLDPLRTLVEETSTQSAYCACHGCRVLHSLIPAAREVLERLGEKEMKMELSTELAWQETAAYAQRGLDYYRSLVVKIGETIGESAYIADDGGTHDDVLCAKVPELVAALQAERDHYKRESELGATMLGVIVSSLGLGTKATTKAGASVQDVLDHVAALKAEVENLRIAHARADGALADAETVKTGDLELGIRALTAERDGLRDWVTRLGDNYRAAEADARALAEAAENGHRYQDCVPGEPTDHRPGCALCTALARPGVVRVREE